MSYSNTKPSVFFLFTLCRRVNGQGQRQEVYLTSLNIFDDQLVCIFWHTTSLPLIKIVKNMVSSSTLEYLLLRMHAYAFCTLKYSYICND